MFPSTNLTSLQLSAQTDRKTENSTFLIHTACIFWQRILRKSLQHLAFSLCCMRNVGPLSNSSWTKVDLLQAYRPTENKLVVVMGKMYSSTWTYLNYDQVTLGP
ncbi:hypothetical protein CDAR_45001 [Caerostris darwini]|uniref:Uncharacterized protein n=1 Tax=Caerostris darwini TaxID=1538125 RepID=A0AAV4UXR0_9ARAC|nr:hypothetical protein CDAR_45001 [Caerostris darwini]